MKLKINDIIEVKFKNMSDVCHYYVCESDILNKLNARLPYALISLDKGKVELCFHSLDFREVEYYLNHCDNSNYGIESIDICHKGNYKLVYKINSSNTKKPKKHKNQVDELINRFGRY